MSTYATLDDLKAYSDYATGVDDAVLQRALDRGEIDLDRELALPIDGVIETTNLKYDPAQLSPAWVAAALNRATCAQAEYRLVMGEEFFVRPQHTRVRGPDFQTFGTLPWLAPKAVRELAGTGLLAPADITTATIVSPTIAAARRQYLMP